MALAGRTLRLLAANKNVLTAFQRRNYSDELSLTFAAANKVFYDSVDVKQVDVPSFSGAFGILAKHVPTLAVLKPGVVTVYEKDGNTKKIFVSSGTVTINEDSTVQVLAEEAHPVEDLDPSSIRELLTTSQSQLAQASGDQAKAEAAIAVEVAEALNAAVH
ncbi:ATP synthase subunit delta, mitochondrial-like [Ctenocephalides felis]|uniref:ATP synthase subunit delta, mitochondrial-like n=1 Tax=Ctenocephalides felis TaxID=7515 RepID=UPI000E6E4738|nr:ATP synthase subunit delta, mitochondrial-like [Ctenocephalides felis]XP_026471903.1 ATP synthase subunit delta, mitochondrial-like [Ctenocephalides felis]